MNGTPHDHEPGVGARQLPWPRAMRPITSRPPSRSSVESRPTSGASATTWRRASLICFLILVSCREPTETTAPTAPMATPTTLPSADAFTAASEPTWPGRIVVDGEVDEWPRDTGFLADPLDDAALPFDVTWLRAARRGDHLFVAFEIREAENLYAGDGPGLVLVVEGATKIRIDFRRRRVEVDGRRKRWSDVGAFVAPSHAARRFEIALRYAGAARVRLEGTDEVGPLEVDATGTEMPARSPARAPGTWLRIATLNTDRAGLVDLQRAAATKRLLAAVQADVICLQELGRASPRAVEEAFPGRHVYAAPGPGVVGNAIVSRWPLRPIATGSPRLAATIVEDATPLVVVSVHLPCCGHLGSDQDHARLEEARRLADWLADLRRGAVAGISAEAAIVVAGDFNDVGARTLREILAAATLTLAPTTHLVRPATFTWAKAASQFPPSTLDLVFHGTDLRKTGGFVLDTTELDEPTLHALGLLRTDSLASDHRLVVVDLAPQ
jgi:endonuclease/exonuclease/phosphatase family metal-dependent hydrolase